MLYSEYKTTFTTAFVEFNQRLIEARSNFIDYEILKDEQILRTFVIDIFALRKIYDKSYESDMHTEFLQPKVEIIYDLVQHNIEDVRNGDSEVCNVVSRLIEEMFKYCKAISKPVGTSLN
jgi:hypothetical protein